MKPYKTRRHFMAECECGWVVDGFGPECRVKIERERASHQKKCPDSITWLSSSVTKVWNLKTLEAEK